MDEIIKLVKEMTGADNVTENSELENDLGCTGDDFSELMEEYSKKFNVDMSNYIWYFHHYEEGNSITLNLFGYKSPAETVKQIPVTPKMLYDFSKIGKWNIEYPEHEIPNNRLANLANQILLLLIASAIILILFLKYYN
ncbi:hypothetical protein FLJC2902T_30820 [Flavobacterium limnosediminis JC2902]|uniref:DUF1493 family protein n=1 Tax=Flavobacterium limnosediminis JC2902 TaxID=1341181 RepID=V6SH87_9FLAO|nr:DUF1493 family protein [Flavobacterium limnosediminis]ESU25632.1 hypothetical protein FLJC2902T_30820 [Flavobacterium limnosediminis JC2902]